MENIKLPRGKWQYDPNTRLGKAGGFGEVFRGRALKERSPSSDSN